MHKKSKYNKVSIIAVRRWNLGGTDGPKARIPIAAAYAHCSCAVWGAANEDSAQQPGGIRRRRVGLRDPGPVTQLVVLVHNLSGKMANRCAFLAWKGLAAG